MKISKIVKPVLIAASVGGAFVFGFSTGAVTGAGLMYFGIEDIQKKAEEKDAESVEKLYADTMDDMIKTNQKTQWADWARESDQMDRRITGLMAIGHSAVEIAEMLDITLSEVRARSSAEFKRKMTKLSDQVFAMYRGGQSVKTISASLDMSESTVLTRLKGSIAEAIADATTAGAPQEEIAKLVAMSVEISQPGEVIEMDVASAKWEEIASVFKQMYNVELSDDQKLKSLKEKPETIIDRMVRIFKAGADVDAISLGFGIQTEGVRMLIRGRLSDEIADATLRGASEEEISELVAHSMKILRQQRESQKDSVKKAFEPDLEVANKMFAMYREGKSVDYISKHTGLAQCAVRASLMESVTRELEYLKSSGANPGVIASVAELLEKLTRSSKLMKSSTYGKDQSKAMADVEEELRADPRKIVVRDGGIAGKDDKRTEAVKIATDFLVQYLKGKNKIGDEDITLGLLDYKTADYGWSVDLQKIHSDGEGTGWKYRVVHHYDPKCTDIIQLGTGVTVATTGVDDIPNPEDAMPTTES